MSNDTTLVTIISANLGPQFQGRATLVRAAEQGNPEALALLSMTPAKRLIKAIKREMCHDFVKALGLTDELNRIDRLRSTRDITRTVHDTILNRKANNVTERTTLQAFRAALEIADFRTATHSHGLKITYVPVGQEQASSASGRESASSAGMSAAYCRKAWFIANSQHNFSVSTAFLKVPPAKRAGRGWIQLTTELKIVQSRGTSLRTEHKAQKLAA